MLVKIENLHFRYPGVSELALADINLEVSEGEFVAIVGRAGAGKTSLVNCLNGTVPHFQEGEWAGNVLINGQLTTAITIKVLAQLVGTVSSDPDRQMVAVTVEEEVAFGLENLCMAREEIESRLIEALDMVGALHLRYRATSSLSGGEKGRIALAAVLALRPKLLILDEPIAELDPAGAEQVMRAITNLHQNLGTTILYFESRLVNVVEYAQRIVLLNKGLVVADGPTRKIAYDEKALDNAGLIPPPITMAVLEARKCESAFVGKYPLTMNELQQMVLDSQKSC